MIIIMKTDATEEQIDHVINEFEDRGFDTHLSEGEQKTVIGIIGDTHKLSQGPVESMDGVEQAMKVQKPYKLASREFHPKDSTVQVDDVEIGGEEVVIMAGPCSVESYDQMLESAEAVKKAGAKVLRGGAYKPRTSPYSFQGLGEEGLEIMKNVAEETGLKMVTEVMGPNQVEQIGEFTDIFQLGARNMQNYNLLRAVGRTDTPVLLKRGFRSKIDEFLLAAEYIMNEGNEDVILCCRGIRTFDRAHTRNTMDINAVAVLNKLSHLPVVMDPSHGTGKRDLVPAGARAAVAAGADGLLVESHRNPENALSDGPQQLPPEMFSDVMDQLRDVASAVGRTIQEPLEEEQSSDESTPAAVSS
jgi:3-deoxy-7-phosphoheptulonate synthase